MPGSELYPRRPLDPASTRPLFVAPEGRINLRRCSAFAYTQSLRSLTGPAIPRPSRTITPCYRGRSINCVETAIRCLIW